MNHRVSIVRMKIIEHYSQIIIKNYLHSLVSLRTNRLLCAIIIFETFRKILFICVLKASKTVNGLAAHKQEMRRLDRI